MGKIVTVFNQKGGVGKTTTVVNLSVALASKGQKVLVIDMDPQANATSGLGVEQNREPMIYDVLTGSDSIDAIVASESGVDVLPSGGDLAGIEMEITAQKDWQFSLKRALEPVRENYDYIILDSPPSLGVLSLMSLTASDGILIPVQCEYYALEGVTQLMKTIELVKTNFNPDLEIEGVVMCMFDGRTNLSIQVVDEVKKYFKSKVMHTMIPRNVRLAEAPSFGMSILEYDEKSRGAIAYKKLAEEMLKRG